MDDPSTPGDSQPPLAVDGSELRCPACDYDLRALHGDRCPECGLLLDRVGMSVSQIPWTHRGEMGRFRAFRKTCWMVFRHPRRITADAARPVSFRDAKQFQLAVILTMYLPMLVIGAFIFFGAVEKHSYERVRGIWAITSQILASDSPARHEPPPGRLLGWILEGVGLILDAVWLWLLLYSATGVASYFFHPRDLSIPRQNRAIALSYYACAPLAWTPASILLALSMAIFLSNRWGISGVQAWEIESIIGGGLVISVCVQLVAWLRCTLVLLKQTTRCSGGRVLTAGISLPFLWLMCGVLTCVVLPAAYLLVCMVIMSLL